MCSLTVVCKLTQTMFLLGERIMPFLSLLRARKMGLKYQFLSPYSLRNCEKILYKQMKERRILCTTGLPFWRTAGIAGRKIFVRMMLNSISSNRSNIILASEKKVFDAFLVHIFHIRQISFFVAECRAERFLLGISGSHLFTTHNARNLSACIL